MFRRTFLADFSSIFAMSFYPGFLLQNENRKVISVLAIVGVNENIFHILNVAKSNSIKKVLVSQDAFRFLAENRLKNLGLFSKLFVYSNLSELTLAHSFDSLFILDIKPLDIGKLNGLFFNRSCLFDDCIYEDPGKWNQILKLACGRSRLYHITYTSLFFSQISIAQNYILEGRIGTPYHVTLVSAVVDNSTGAAVDGHGVAKTLHFLEDVRSLLDGDFPIRTRSLTNDQSYPFERINSPNANILIEFKDQKSIYWEIRELNAFDSRSCLIYGSRGSIRMHGDSRIELLDRDGNVIVERFLGDSFLQEQVAVRSLHLETQIKGVFNASDGNGNCNFDIAKLSVGVESARCTRESVYNNKSCKMHYSSS